MNPVYFKTYAVRRENVKLHYKTNALVRLIALLGMVQIAGVCVAQEPVKQSPRAATVSALQAELFEADTLDKVLAKLQPPVTLAQLAQSDYLLLDVPPVALAGIIPARVMSEIPGTDLLLLFNATPRLKESSLLAVQEIPPLAKADVRVSVKLTHSTGLLLVARANGRWYKVTSEVKVAQKDRPPAKVR